MPLVEPMAGSSRGRAADPVPWGQRGRSVPCQTATFNVASAEWQGPESRQEIV